MPARLLASGDRRMEAENYLSRGYGIRLAIQARLHGWASLNQVANVWQPYRLKGTQVSSEFGTPFLAATQVFDVRPVPRKWLALQRTDDAARRFVEHGTILVTCSGSVGRATLAFDPHLKVLITHDLLRVQVRNDKAWGWVYAYLRAPRTRAMMTGTRYGQIIKHLESSHLNALPIPQLRDALLGRFNRRALELLALRDQAHVAAIEADTHLEKRLGVPKDVLSEAGFSVRAGLTMMRTGRRLDASRHAPLPTAIRKHLSENGRAVTPLFECGYEVWVPGRYKRVPADDGVVFVDSSDLFEINPDITKRFADCKFGDVHKGRVMPGWLLMASSGLTYGIVGGVVLATPFYEDKVLANHVIRIAAKKDASARPGYVVTALGHPTLGRPLVKSLAFGSSVPEIAPEDVASLGLVRLSETDENYIADLAEKSASLRAEADILENSLAAEAEEIIERFIAGNMSDVVTL